MNSTAALSILVLGPIVGAGVAAFIRGTRAIIVVAAAILGEAIAYGTLALWSARSVTDATTGSGTQLFASGAGVSWTNQLTALAFLLCYVLAVAGGALLVRRFVRGTAPRAATGTRS